MEFIGSGTEWTIPEGDMNWITIRVAAEIAQLSKRMVYAAVERKELRVSRIGSGRNMRTTEEWVNAWLTANASAAPSSRMAWSSHRSGSSDERRRPLPQDLPSA